MKVVPRSAERQNRAGARRDFENVRNTNSGALNKGDWPAVLRPLARSPTRSDTTMVICSGGTSYMGFHGEPNFCQVLYSL